MSLKALLYQAHQATHTSQAVRQARDLTIPSLPCSPFHHSPQPCIDELAASITSITLFHYASVHRHQHTTHAHIHNSFFYWTHELRGLCYLRLCLLTWAPTGRSPVLFVLLSRWLFYAPPRQYRWKINDEWKEGQSDESVRYNHIVGFSPSLCFSLSFSGCAFKGVYCNPHDGERRKKGEGRALCVSTNVRCCVVSRQVKR